ncbi:MAG TPA: aminopeptidase P N-terminal domain-containing protein [Byssovorax sp.]|jgi:Xaa-Pro aminopeptidase
MHDDALPASSLVAARGFVLPRGAFAERRRLHLEQLGADGAAVYFAAPTAVRNATVQHEYRQDSDLYYLTGFEEPESALLLLPGHETPVVLFVRPRDAEREAWDGERAGVEGAIERFGADAAFPIGELDARLPALLAGRARLHHRLGQSRAADERVIEALTRGRARQRATRAGPIDVCDPSRALHELRLRKSDDEISVLRSAAEITRDGHLAAMRLAAPGRHEYELDAILRETFRARGAERCCYAPIVGSGPNAAIVHYRKNRRCMQDGELVLVDAGCELGYLGSDVTRTFPVSGTFAPAHRRLYEAVLEAQEEAIEAVRPGATLDDIHAACERRLAAAMVELGILAKDAEPGAHLRYFNHRTSHWLGMDVHDAGAYHVGGEPRRLEPGMVLTIEPGIYVRSGDDRAPLELRGVGVRIEDDVLVTHEGGSVLTHDTPKRVRDVERACR